MTISSKRIVVELFMIPAFLLSVLVLLPSADSIRETSNSSSSDRIARHDVQKVSPQLSFQIILHGFLLWASMAFLMPIGILIGRMSNRVKCGKSLKILFYCHVFLQAAAVVLATAGAVLAVKNFDNKFNNTHQRIGLALYVFIWMQPLIGFCRPNRGKKERSIWYFVHWFIGIGVSVTAIANVYIGLKAYHAKTSRSTRIWTILFTIQVSLMIFIYLLQDKWESMQKQGVIMGHEQVIPSDQVHSPPVITAGKETLPTTTSR